MNWRSRYLQQSQWTSDLRAYILEKAGLLRAKRILEAGCGSGAVLSQLPESPAARHGLDLSLSALTEAKRHASGAVLLQADAHALPYASHSFDIAYCHFLLLWTQNPVRALREMARVSRCVIAFAEPDYSQRRDEPLELKPAGAWQNESLRRQGANPAFGARLADAFFEAGIRIAEAGQIRPAEAPRESGGQAGEWAVMESDLRHVLSPEEIRRIALLDEKARAAGRRVLSIPTFFAWGWSD